eukprot:TRINITY_DN823_c0_g1_i2.p1 TRINITY_DN823_c0_g1~~TRINITY_DN823_c0_g1_i2.p1  ORF type:complete len:130 (-),score=31.93 TRINITY_DN823_c0_g1_i2:71-439(-)
MAEEVDWEAQWSNIVETGQTEDRFAKTAAEESLILPSLEDIDQSVTHLASQLTEGLHHLTEEVQKNFLGDWVHTVCVDVKESLSKEDKEEAATIGSWTDMLLPSPQKLPFKEIRKHFGITID